MNVLIPLGGQFQEFNEQGYKYPKYLVEIKGKPLIQRVIENLQEIGDAQYIFVIKKQEAMSHHLDEVIRLLAPESKIIFADGETSGAACTALLAIEAINNEEPLLIANGDQVIRDHIGEICKSFYCRGLDGGIVTFEAVHPRWSYVRVDHDNLVVETAEKRPISRKATAGLYYFRQGLDFVSGAKDMIKKDSNIGGNFFICPVYNELVLKHRKIGIYEIKRENYCSLATPQDIEIYEAYLSHVSV